MCTSMMPWWIDEEQTGMHVGHRRCMTNKSNGSGAMLEENAWVQACTVMQVVFEVECSKDEAC